MKACSGPLHATRPLRKTNWKSLIYTFGGLPDEGKEAPSLSLPHKLVLQRLEDRLAGVLDSVDLLEGQLFLP